MVSLQWEGPPSTSAAVITNDASFLPSSLLCHYIDWFLHVLSTNFMVLFVEEVFTHTCIVMAFFPLIGIYHTIAGKVIQLACSYYSNYQQVDIISVSGN